VIDRCGLMIASAGGVVAVDEIEYFDCVVASAKA
jgi:hypothetical protein